MASKRKRAELKDLDSLEEPVSNASVHGVLCSLSPVKKGRKSSYFEGVVSDGKSKVRLVGFSNTQQLKMREFMDNKKAIHLNDCEVKQARRGPKMEIMLKGSTTIISSPKKFHLENIDFQEESAAATIRLEELVSLTGFLSI